MATKSTKTRTTKNGKSGKASRNRKSPEQRAAEAKALHDTLTAQVEALADADAWKRYLAFVGSFHNYSLTNVLLILAQKPDATLVAGFRQWQAKGRQVRKGERSIKIRGFSAKKVTEEQEDGTEVEKMLARFPILSVFDVSQTEAIDGVEQPENPAKRLSGDDPTGIYEAAAAHMRALGWTVIREPIAGETNGYTTVDGTKRIVVDDALSPAQAAKTMLHEAAHATLHVDPETGKGDPEQLAHRGRGEVEAESVAYVLAGLAGLDTSDYSVGYVTGWAGGKVELVRETAENVLRAVKMLSPIVVENDSDEANPTSAETQESAAA